MPQGQTSLAGRLARTAIRDSTNCYQGQHVLLPGTAQRRVQVLLHGAPPGATWLPALVAWQAAGAPADT